MLTLTLKELRLIAKSRKIGCYENPLIKTSKYHKQNKPKSLLESITRSELGTYNLPIKDF